MGINVKHNEQCEHCEKNIVSVYIVLISFLYSRYALVGVNINVH